jgi:hypothetical protein
MDTPQSPMDFHTALNPELEPVIVPQEATTKEVLARDEFVPAQPKSLREAGLHQNDLFPVGPQVPVSTRQSSRR